LGPEVESPALHSEHVLIVPGASVDLVDGRRLASTAHVEPPDPYGVAQFWAREAIIASLLKEQSHGLMERSPRLQSPQAFCAWWRIKKYCRPGDSRFQLRAPISARVEFRLQPIENALDRFVSLSDYLPELVNYIHRKISTSGVLTAAIGL